MNVDAKIGSKSIARRICKVLPTIIHSDQCAYVKDRLISDALRTIDDVMWYTEINKIPGWLVAIDFEKAFDSVNVEFLIKALEAFNFGQTFIKWIRTFYNGAKSCVINNGFTSHYFDLQRGVRQGDPLSPYLFIVVMEVLSISIRKDVEIKGLVVDEKEIKLTSFADDLTTFLKDIDSLHKLMHKLKLFGSCSGLKPNIAKTEVLRLGPSQKDVDIYSILNIPKPLEPPKILGVYFTYDNRLRDRLNFENHIKSVKKLLAQWRRRNLTILGKIQVIKSLIIPKFLYRLTNTTASETIVKEINKIMFNFIWNGQDKIKRLAIINDIDKGGFRMTHLESAIEAQRILFLKRYANDENRSWKYILDSCLKNVGGSFLLNCNFDVSSLPVTIPCFYKECLKSWTTLMEWDNETLNGVLEQPIWNNKLICIQNKSVYYPKLIKMGILTIRNMLTESGNFLCFNELKQKETTFITANYFLWLGIVHSLPCEWRRMIKAGNIGSFSQPTQPRNLCSDQIRVKLDENNVFEIQALTSKQIYKKLVTKRTIEPTSKAKFTAIFSENNLDWANIYKIPFNSTLDTRTRAFQLKILHRILFTNSSLFKMKISATPLCTFCDLESETLEHLFVDCEYVKSFWEAFTAWVNSLGIVLNRPTGQEIMLGITGNNDDC
ncbi:hypothetical protein ACROYT_G003968 [Oculina patagonica]